MKISTKLTKREVLSPETEIKVLDEIYNLEDIMVNAVLSDPVSRGLYITLCEDFVKGDIHINDWVCNPSKNKQESVEDSVRKIINNSSNVDLISKEISKFGFDKNYIITIGKSSKSLEVRKATLDYLEKRDFFLESNIRLVISVAKKYKNRGKELKDLIQEGTMGLIKSLSKFDRSRKNKFSTHATWWIRQAIARSLANKARTIRLPVHAVEDIDKIAKAKSALTVTLNREPSLKEISRMTDISESKVEALLRYSKYPISLSAPTNKISDSDWVVGDFIEDDSPTPESDVMIGDIDNIIYEIFSVLTPREEKVLRMRFGLGQYNELSCKEIGMVFNVTDTRVRQIEKDSINKIRSKKKGYY